MKKIEFEDLQVPDIPRQTIHFEWDDLRDMADETLFHLLRRKVSVDVERSDYYDWGFTLIDDSLSLAELETLFTMIEADDWDRESNDFYDAPIQSLSQSLSRKLVSLLLPFHAESTHADDEGVWFISGFTGSQTDVKPVFPDELPTDETLLVKLIQDGIEYELKAYEDEVCRKGIKELWAHLYAANIYKEVTSMAMDDLGHYFNSKVDMTELRIIYDLAKRGNFLEGLKKWALDTGNLDISTHDAIAQLIQEFCESFLEQEE